MAPRKNAKGGGGNSSSSGSGSGSGSPSTGSSGSSSSPGARREAKHGGHKNGRRGGISGGSFFTWFMVIALLGVWTSVAVVWFDLVDYEEVLAKAKDFRYNLSEVLQGKLGVYDADGDGDFDVDDAKVLLGLTKDGSNENIDSLEEVLTILAEESSDWFYGFLSFLYDIMTPFEMLEEEEEEEESETADGVDGLKERSPSERTFPPEEEAETQAEPEERGPEGAEIQNVEDEVKEQIQPLLQESVHTDHDLEADGPTGDPQPEVEDFLTVTDSDDRFEDLEPGTDHEEIEDSYHVEETASPNHLNEVEEIANEQEDSDPSEAVTDADVLQPHAEEVRHQDYEEPVYEPSEHERIEISDIAVDDSSTISEEINVASVEEQQDTPPVKKKKPKLLNKFDKTIKAELDAAEKLRKRGKIEEAVSAFEELVRKYPQSPRARYGKAQVLNVTPNDGFAKVHYGFILKAQNKIAESIPYLKEGIESGDPGTDDGRFYFHLGDAMQRVGNKEAYKWYELGHKRGHFASVWQRSLYNVNGLKAQPWWTPRETGYTELVKSLERNWKLIRDEGLMVMDRAKGLFLPEDENLREKGDWSQFTLWQQGRKNENACKGAPKTCALLEKFSETTGCRRGQIKYSIMHPGTHVWPHTGPTNCRLRMHLGLVIPKEGCKIRCANETRTWEEGKVLIFDDSFEHEVWQDASSFRLIFIVDVWHPELTPQQRRSLPAI
ncbi:aspartyl/asparaginyl beta-hydroxylase isoform X11 [Mus pahari]|uniref:aspartyl/asparaginyl beta-hydroxylase isoform X11 n=1 Tax=Mus pahari TaxID=10093 RepID=UPI0011149E14|nr:aspartyl/asparaginyl beta-hydroxylase isoform X11 [Mus pahari]